jgi:hypothetical protein
MSLFNRIDIGKNEGGISLDCVQIAVEFDWFLFWWPRIWESNQIFGPRFYDINNATNNTSSPITFDTNIHRVCGLYLESNPRKISLFFRERTQKAINKIFFSFVAV